jgi:hypothetical protein
MSQIRTTVLGVMGLLLGAGIGLIMLVTMAGLGITGSGLSTAITSAVTSVQDLLPLIGIGVGFGLALTAITLISGRSR